LLGAALAYAEKGWKVIPLHNSEKGACSCRRKTCDHPAKHPRCLHGLSDATDDPGQIGKWWSMFPDANIGIACKASGLIVLDIDERSGGVESLWRLIDKVGELPPTLTVRTGNGWHYYYLAPAGLDKMRGQLDRGVDVKFDGYVVAPPSIHVSGAVYHFLENGVDTPQQLSRHLGGIN
jgi:hypothetical protein